MTEIEILTKQTEDAYQWVHNLIDTIPSEKWDELPEIVASNVTWQVGHLVISIYYHSVMAIVGHQQDILEQLPMRDYTKLFSFGTVAKNSIGKMNPNQLEAHLKIIEARSIAVITALPIESLPTDLEPTKMPHPIANTKFEAISWNVKHTMWHCGQIALIKRVIDKPYDYGIRRT